MKEAGYTAAVIGVAVALLSLLMTTSLPSASDYGEVINIGLLQNQALVFQGGCFLFIAGVVFAAAGVIVDQLRVGAIAPIEPRTAAQEHTTDTVEFDDQVAASHRVAPSDPDPAAGPAATRLALSIGGVLILTMVMIAVLVAWGRTSSGERERAERAAMERNVAALVDNMEIQADNLDVMADDVAGEAPK